MQKVIPWLALGVAVVAAVMAVVGLTQRGAKPIDESVIEERVYARIVREVQAELAPICHDFGIETPADPTSLKDVLRPLVGVTSNVDENP